MTYELGVLRTASELERIVPAWHRLRDEQSRPHPEQDPEWLLLRFKDRDVCDLEVVTLRRDGELLGLAPIIKNYSPSFAWRLRLPGRDYSLVKWKLRQAQFVGDALLAEESASLQQVLLGSVFAHCSDCHLVAFRHLSRDSMLYQILTQERRSSFKYLWRAREPQPHWLIKIEGNFTEFESKQLSPRRRRDMRREQRRLNEACNGQLRFVVLTRPDEVDMFVRGAMSVADRSWQGQRIEAATRLNDAAVQFKRLAEHNLFRGYLMMNGEQPIAQLHGRLSASVFLQTATSYDPEWAKFSPGAQLQHFVISDLFALGKANWFDFGSLDLWYKESWATHSFDEDTAYCLSAAPKLALAAAPTIVTRGCLSMVSKAMRRFGLETSFRRFLYRIGRGPAGG